MTLALASYYNSTIETVSHLGIPVSTTHVISSSILGVGAAKPFARVKWSIAGRVVMAWVVTIPVCIGLGVLSGVVCGNWITLGLEK